MEQQKYYCKVCKEQIHPRRAALGYKTTCVNHSSSEKYVGFVTDIGEETYEIQVIKDREVAKELTRLHKKTGQVKTNSHIY